MLGKLGRRDEAWFTEGFDAPISRRGALLDQHDA
jgi:hypothetical protein